MRIKPISFNLYKTYNNSFKNNAYNTPLKLQAYDSIVFKGAPKRKVSAKDRGIEMSKRMIKLSQEGKLTEENISQLMNSHSKNEIKICKVKDLGNLGVSAPGEIIAYVEPHYDDDFNFLDAGLYLGDFSSIKSPQDQSDFIANAAHEFTHIIQRSQDKNLNGILKYFKNIDDIQIISRIGFEMLGELVYIQLQHLDKNNDDKDKKTQILNEIKNGRFTIKKYARDVYLKEQIEQIADTVAKKKSYDATITRKAFFEWMYNTARNEEEAYEVTIAAYNKCKDCNEETKIKRIFTKEAYKYVADELESYIKK